MSDEKNLITESVNGFNAFSSELSIQLQSLRAVIKQITEKQ